MAEKDKKDPIIVKRVKHGGHGHHGGVWKIVYADFVTAMMAFFLLMWILGSTTTGDLAGISAYFQNPLRVQLQGSDQGTGDASKIVRGGGPQIFRSAGEESRADADNEQRRISDSRVVDDERLRKDNVSMIDARLQLERQLSSDAELSKLRNQVFMEVTQEGLRIQIVDDRNRPMFAVGSANLSSYGSRLLRVIGGVLSEMPNRVRVEGHTDSLLYAGSAAGYTNWELSSDRANAARRELVVGGLRATRIDQVIGFADTQHINVANPSDPMNRRISIFVLNSRGSQTEASSSAASKPRSAQQQPSPATSSPSSSAVPATAPSEQSGRSPVLVLPPKTQIVPPAGVRP